MLALVFAVVVPQRTLYATNGWRVVGIYFPPSQS
jgi:hypothetical protein